MGSATVTMHVEVLLDGQATPVAGYDGVTLDAGLRTTVDLADPKLTGGAGVNVRRSLRVRADGPLAVETSLAPAAAPGQTPRGVSDIIAVPVRDGMTVPYTDVLALAAAAAPENPPPESPPATGGQAPATGAPGTTRPSR